MKGFTACFKMVAALLLVLSFLAADSRIAHAFGGGLKPGDILFASNVQTEDWEGEKFYTRFWWEHAAIYVGEGLVVESISEEYGSPLPGTRVVTLTEFLEQWNRVEVKRLSGEPWRWSYRLQRSQVTRKQVIQAAVAYALKQAELKTPYNWKAGKFGDSALYCSQLVWNAFHEVASVDLDSNGGINVPPDDIYRSSWLRSVSWQESPPSPEQNLD